MMMVSMQLLPNVVETQVRQSVRSAVLRVVAMVLAVVLVGVITQSVLLHGGPTSMSGLKDESNEPNQGVGTRSM